MHRSTGVRPYGRTPVLLMFSASAIRFIQRAAERRIFDRFGLAGVLCVGVVLVGGNFPAGGGILFGVGTVDDLHLRFNGH